MKAMVFFMASKSLIQPPGLSVGTVCEAHEGSESGSGDVVVLGNQVDAGMLWCIELATLKHRAVSAQCLLPKPPREQLQWKDLRDLVAFSASLGDGCAMWWMGWLLDGAQSPYALWYKLAAARCRSDLYGAFYSRILSAANAEYNRDTRDKPRAKFIAEVKDLCKLPGPPQWQALLRMAEAQQTQAKRRGRDVALRYGFAQRARETP